MAVSTRLVKRIGSLSLDDELGTGLLPPRGDLNDGLVSCFKATRRTSQFRSLLIDNPIPQRQRNVEECKLLAKGGHARTVIKLKDHERYWSVDENGVVTTEEFYEHEEVRRPSRLYSIVELLFVVIITLSIWAGGERAVLLERIVNQSIQAIQLSLEEYL